MDAPFTNITKSPRPREGGRPPKMTKRFILCLDTANELCELALIDIDSGAVRSLRSEEGRRHAEVVFGLTNKLLKDAGAAKSEIAAVAFGEGPGGFTGLRVACGIAQGLAWGLNIPVIPVNNLRILAAAVRLARPGFEGVAAAMNDARMNECYTAVHAVTADGLEEKVESRLVKPAEVASFLAENHADVVVGNAPAAYPEAFEAAGVAHVDAEPHFAEAFATLAREDFLAGRTIDPKLAAPLYVRDRVALTRAQREAGERL